MIAILGEAPSLHERLCAPPRERESERCDLPDSEAPPPSDQPRVMISLRISS